MNTFSFNKEVLYTAVSGYAVCVVPTNLANWGNNAIVGNVTGVNIGEGDMGIYFTRDNPASALGIQLDDQGCAEMSLGLRTIMQQYLDANKLLYIPGSTALLGMSLDWISFTDLNWLTVITKGSETDLHAYVQLLQQVTP